MSGSLLVNPTPPVTISFNEIPANLQVPGTFVEIAANYDQSGLVAFPAKVLILCPIASGGTITPLVPVQVFTPQQAAALLGQGGIGHRMVKAFIRANPWTPLYVMGLPAPTGSPAAATWTVGTQSVATLTGPAGTLPLYIGGKQYAVTVTPGVDTSNTIAANLQAVIAADPDCPVTATVSGFQVTLTARDKGAIGNQLDVRFCLNPSDIVPGGQTNGTNNLNATVTNNNTGAGVHSVANAFAAIPSTWFTHFIIPWNDAASLSAVQTELDRRWGAMVGLDARAFSFASASNMTNLLAVTSGLNSRFLSVLGMLNAPTAPWEMAALYGAVAVFNLLNDPARQLRNLVLPGAVAPVSADILTEAEQQQLLTAGIATPLVGTDGTVRIQRAVTTYQAAPGGIPDTAWMDIMTAEVVSRIRYDWISYIGLTYPRNKMAADGSLAAEYDDQIVTPRRMHSSWASRCRLYEQLGWIQNSGQTAKQSVFQLDPNNPNRMNARQQIQVMNNLMILAGQLQFSLQAQASSTAQSTPPQ